MGQLCLDFAPADPAVRPVGAEVRTGRMGFEGTGHGVTLAFPNERTVMEKTPHLPGKFIWFEHVSNDIAKARAFYEQLFGWHVESMPMGNQTYRMLMNGDGGVGGYRWGLPLKRRLLQREGARLSDAGGAERSASAARGRA